MRIATQCSEPDPAGAGASAAARCYAAHMSSPHPPWIATLVAPLVALAMLAPGCRREQAAPDPTAAPAARRSLSPRLVSLTPSATEVVAALGAASLLVGVDEYSTYPAEVAALPKVGSFLTPNLEAIAALRPTLVVVDDVHGQTAGALGDAGIATVACAIHGLGDVKAALRTLGARIGRTAEAELQVEAAEAALDHAAASRPARRPRVLAVIDREAGGLGNLVTAGPGSWIDELLAVSGGDNVMRAASVRYPMISAEEVLRARPDVILDLSYAARQGVEPWRGLDVPAVTAGRIRALDAAYLIAPSPRVAEALATLAEALRDPGPP
jgi:iron complex transport system substrate-binding protein